MQRTSVITLLCFGACVSLAVLFGSMRQHQHHTQATHPTNLTLAAARSASIKASYAKLPIAFESNQGQVDKQVKFLSHGAGYNLFLTSNEAVLTLHHPQTTPFPASKRQEVFHTAHPQGGNRNSSLQRAHAQHTASVLRLILLGANAHPVVSGQQKLPGIVNYFLSNDPKKWRTHVPTFSRVAYSQVYPGIDMVYYGNQQQLEYDWVLAPGADVHQIKLEVKGAEKATLTEYGDLLLHTACGDVVEHAPVVYQKVGGERRSVKGRLVLQEAHKGVGECRIGFEVAAYDHSRPLVIDPVLVYSTYLGGSQTNSASGIAVDPEGNAYVAGYTDSPDFPLEVPYQSNGYVQYSFPTVEYAASVSVINASGTALIYSTYLAGQYDSTFAYAIAVDSSGNAYVAGSTESPDFPLKNPLQSNSAGAFVTELNSSGSALIFSTCLGGAGGGFQPSYDRANAITVDSSGNIYVAGTAESTDFLLKNPIQSVNHSSNGTGFVSKISPTGPTLVYSTYLGGSGSESYGDFASGIAVDGSGNAYITGGTSSTDFPLQNAFQSANHATEGFPTGFLTKINATGSALVYSTFLGGSTEDQGNAIAVNSSGNAYVTGVTYSTDFPTQNPLQATNHAPGTSAGNAFVTEINPTGSTLVYSTYLGGSAADAGNGIALDSSDNAYITGSAISTNFPTKNAIQSVNNNAFGQANAFVTEINPTGSALIYSTYLGGSSTAFGNRIAVDSFGNAYVCGGGGDGFPMQNPFQPTTSGSSAFIVRIGNYNWQTVDIAVGSDNQTRLLWNNTTSTMGLWSINNSGVASGFENYGPYTGYAVQALTTGTDGFTRLLWNNNLDDIVGLWLLNANNTYANGFSFTPGVGWSAIDVAVGSDNKTRMLWTKSDGSTAVWSVDNTGNVTNATNLGSDPGWTAYRIAAGSDGYTRLLLRKTDGTVGLWLLNSDNSYNNSFNFGPYSGATVVDLSVGSDNKTRLLWTDRYGNVAIWSVDNSGVISHISYIGPYTNWTASRIASGSDGYTRLLWFKADGTQALWLLNSNNKYYNGFNYGPY